MGFSFHEAAANRLPASYLLERHTLGIDDWRKCNQGYALPDDGNDAHIHPDKKAEGRNSSVHHGPGSIFYGLVGSDVCKQLVLESLNTGIYVPCLYPCPMVSRHWFHQQQNQSQGNNFDLVILYHNSCISITS